MANHLRNIRRSKGPKPPQSVEETLKFLDTAAESDSVDVLDVKADGSCTISCPDMLDNGRTALTQSNPCFMLDATGTGAPGVVLHLGMCISSSVGSHTFHHTFSYCLQ